MTKRKPHKHILVIRLSAMGDVAMTIPVLQALKNSYPNVQVTVLTKKQFAPIFYSLPWVKTHAAAVKDRHKGLLGIIKLFFELKNHKLTEVADLHGVMRSHILRLLFKLNGIKTEKINKGRSEKKKLTATRPKDLYNLKSTHERYADVFRKLGYGLGLNSSHILPKNELPEPFTSFQNQKKIGIAPFASFEGKMYPLELIEYVITDLKKSFDGPIFLFGGGKEEKMKLNQLSNKFNKNVINVTGSLTFADELALISNLDVMLSMDSGNGHLAANYGVPVLTLWGVTHPCLGFAPFGQPEQYSLLADRDKYPLIPTSVYGNKVPLGYQKAIESISTQEIVEKIHLILQSSGQ